MGEVERESRQGFLFSLKIQNMFLHLHIDILESSVRVFLRLLLDLRGKYCRFANREKCLFSRDSTLNQLQPRLHG